MITWHKYCKNNFVMNLFLILNYQIIDIDYLFKILQIYPKSMSIFNQ